MDPRLSEALATFATGYAKRLLTKRTLDRVFESDLGRMALELDTPSKIGIEFALNTIAALSTGGGNPSSVLGQIKRNLITDAPSEITERLFQEPSGSDGARVGRASPNSQRARSAEDALAALLELDEQSLKEIFDWLRDSDEGRRKQALDAATSLTAEQFRSFANLDGGSKAQFLRAVEEEAVEAPLVRQLNIRLRKWLDRVPASKEGQ